MDASVLATALADDGQDGDLARVRLMAETVLHAPELIDLEVTSVLRTRVAAGSLDERRAAIALQDLDDIPLVRYPHLALVRRAWALGANLTPYDAAYVALAELLDASFVTADRALGRVPGVQCVVEVLRR